MQFITLLTRKATVLSLLAPASYVASTTTVATTLPYTTNNQHNHNRALFSTTFVGKSTINYKPLFNTTNVNILAQHTTDVTNKRMMSSTLFSQNTSLSSRHIGLHSFIERKKKKGGGGGGSDGKKSKKNDADNDDNDNEVDTDSIENEMQEALDAAIESLQSKFSNIVASRVTPNLLDHIQVEIKGAESATSKASKKKKKEKRATITSLATITLKDHSTLSVLPNDASYAKFIEDAIYSANMNLTTHKQENNQAIFVNIPKMTQEQRDVLCKEATKIAEGAKESVRRARQNALSSLKKFKKILSKDDSRRFEKQLQQLTDNATSKVTSLLQQKEKELKK